MWKKAALLLLSSLLLIACTQEEKTEYDKQMEIADTAMDSQQYEKAYEAYTAAKKLQKDNNDAEVGAAKANGELNLKKAENAKQKKKEKEKKEQNQDKEKYLASLDAESIQGTAEIKLYELLKNEHTKASETLQKVEYDSKEKSLKVKFEGRDGWSDQSIGENMYEDSAKVYRELNDMKELNEIWVYITFPMKDKDEKIRNEEVMTTWMSRETLNNLDWKKFNYLDLLSVVDGKRIYPQFVVQ